MRFKDKVVIVTGAASGIGRASAIRFADEGGQVVAADVDAEGLDETVQAIGKAGGRAVAVPCDVGVDGDVRRLVDGAVSAHGRLDVVFNNAAIANQPAPIGEMTVADFERTIGTNLTGVFLGCKYAAPVMAGQKSGAIVNCGSVLGLVGRRMFGAYSASKAGIATLTKNVALDYGHLGVRCNCVAPGLIDTNIVKPYKELDLWDRVVRQHILKRPGRAEEVASAVLFLASDEASFITGTTLYVDGGFTAYYF